MQQDTIVEILSILQCRKIPGGIRIRLENLWKPQKGLFLKTNSIFESLTVP